MIYASNFIGENLIPIINQMGGDNIFDVVSVLEVSS
jgi:hypothetical protein